jgi:hypothetical protein
MMIPYLKMIYKDGTAKLYVPELNWSILSREGTQQGDPLGMLIFCFGIKSSVDAIDVKLSELKATAPPEEAADDWCSVWYADDNLGATPFRIFPKIYKFMREQLKDELHLNLVDHKLHCYSPMHSPEKCEELLLKQRLIMM